ncbi:MAG TPA: L-histidine N(alpha)-methyltransferase [Gemmatimonadales bacterium]|nr:L-histidine N(alpha)-methyltransferase [Gemmatimonadales bacterium]
MSENTKSGWSASTVAAYRQPNPRMLAEVAEGLSAPQKELPPKYFYDHRGSELFEEITRLPEYYPTRTERALLEDWMPQLVSALGIRSLVELGAGSAEKSRIILRAMRATGIGGEYVPIDVSASFLNDTATGLRRDYPGLAVTPVVADIAEELTPPEPLSHPALYAFLGGTIGNFYPPAAIRLLGRVRAAMTDGDRFLMGVDLRKDPRRIEAAYNDSQGVTAAFNQNMLLVLNHELGSNFDPDTFEHLAFYEPVNHRIEMHLISKLEQRVRIPGMGLVHFAAGESIRTEISCKHDRSSVTELFTAAGLRLESWRPDPQNLFALVVGARG